jgi:alkanesulfonate monooxygenase SsuD/methylene tetrahydromethanopterin reductase-like flavin-dependent oxidoreductase (luciferase family)
MYLTASLHAFPGYPLAGQFPAMARIAERGGLDAVWLGHGGAGPRLDPLPLLGSLIPVTSRIGLGAAWSLDHSEPFHVARVFATLDHLSGGRTAWLFGMAEEAERFRHVPPRTEAAARERDAEFIAIVRQLWDSWEDAAFLLDVASGRFADPARVYPIHHAGRHFSVRGPLNVPRPPQGNPVLAQAVAGGRVDPAADVLLTAAADAEEVVRQVRAVPHKRVLVDLPPETSADLAGYMADWVARRRCDGFNLLPSGPDELARFVEDTVPLLRAQGLRPDGYTGATLRAHFALPRPRSQFAA